MSRFIEKLLHLSQGTPRPLGFRPRESVEAKPRMQIIVSLTQIETINLSSSLTDAVLVRITGSVKSKDLGKICEAKSDIPYGAWLTGKSSGEIEEIAETRCDFIVFPTAASLARFQSEEVGTVLEVDSSVREGLLRAINDLPVDAVLITFGQEKVEHLTWQHLMLFQYFAYLVEKPLLAAVPSNVTAGELQAIWEAGVSGVVIEDVKAENLAALREEIDKLTFSPHPKPKKRAALVPHVGAEAEVFEEEEEEDE